MEFDLNNRLSRSAINFEDREFDIITKMSEGNPRVEKALMLLINNDERGISHLIDLDDMNMRGSQIWEAYLVLYKGNVKKFADGIKGRSKQMVDFVNQELASVGEEKAVVKGAVKDRNENPDKYRFTEEDVQALEKAREKRMQQEKEYEER